MALQIKVTKNKILTIIPKNFFNRTISFHIAFTLCHNLNKERKREAAVQPELKQTVYVGILDYVKSQGGDYSSWYCGITSDWGKRLFYEHNLPRSNYWWIVLQCYDEVDARAVEAELLQIGLKGGGGGGDRSSVYVYAYLKGPQTNP